MNSSLGGRSVFAGLLRTKTRKGGAFPFAANGAGCSFVAISRLTSRVTRTITRGRIYNVVGYYSNGPIALTRHIRLFVRRRGLSVGLSCNTFPSHPCSSPIVCNSTSGVRRVVGRSGWVCNGGGGVDCK